MSGITLACTWNPRGELPRLQRMLPELLTLYGAVVLSLPPGAGASSLEVLRQLPGVIMRQGHPWPHGRHAALAGSMETGAGHIHYCDLDRLLHWLEAYPAELQQTVEYIASSTEDCTIFGRTDAAWATHPRAMRETEALFNMVFSRMLAQQMDFGAGSKAFTAEAAAHILANSPADAGSFAADCAWPLLLHRAGFSVGYLQVDGLAWETPDHGRSSIAGDVARTQAAQAADSDPAFWASRVEVARAIIEAGMAASGDLPLTG